MLKVLVALLVGCMFLSECHARPIIRVLEDNGEVVGAGTCTMANTQFDCVMVQYEGNLYSVMGTIKGDDFHALFVAKRVGEEWMIVWSWRMEA